MTPVEGAVIFLAGTAAGAINTVVGSGTLITFPVLLALGYPPITANVSNTVGLVPGALSGVVGYRHEIQGQRARIVRFGSASLLGGMTGALLLRVLPAEAFRAIVPALVALALLLVLIQPRLSRRLAAARATAYARPPHESASQPSARDAVTSPHGGWLAYLAIYACGIYGGYFGAAQGVLMVGVLGLALDEGLQRINALKNVLALIVNGIAAAVFIALVPVDWTAALLIAGGSIVGGQIGAVVGRRLAPNALRGVIVVMGLVALARLLSG